MKLSTLSKSITRVLSLPVVCALLLVAVSQAEIRPIPKPTGIRYVYQLAQEANVSLGIFDGAGHLVRSLVRDAHRRSGKNTEFWDGIDQFGVPARPGKYIVRGIYHPPITVVPAVSVGNPGTPAWPTADGKGDWLSDEAPAQAVVTDGTNVYLAAPGSEKGNSIIAVGADGKRIWGIQESTYPRCVSLTLSGQFLYALYSGPVSVHPSTETKGADKIGRAFLVCLDKNTGAPALMSRENTEYQVATWPYVDHAAGLWDLRTHHAFTPANYEGQPRYFANDLGETTEAVGLAAQGGRLYVSMLTQNRLLVLDAMTGKQIVTIPIPEPVGLYSVASGTLLGISAGKVVKIDLVSKTITPLIDHDLDAPHDITTDTAGNIYVSDWGNAFQVKVFSPGGKLLRSIGTPGGRPWIGKWDANGMLLPRGLAVTNSGKLWVAEDDSSPNRVSVWDSLAGKMLRDYIGPSAYGGGGHFWADPADSSRIMAEGTFFNVDYARKTWSPTSTTYRRMSVDEAFTPNAMNGMPGSRTIVHNGKQYVYVSNGSYTMVVLEHVGNIMRPVAAIGSLGRYTTADGSQLSIWDSDIGGHMISHYYPAYFAGHAGDNFIWTDLNGDGRVQPNEMQWVHSLGRGDVYIPGMTPEICVDWGFGAGPDGSVYIGGITKAATVVSRLDLKGWSSTGAPLYDLAAAKPMVVSSSPGSVHGLYVDDKNDLLVTRGYEWNPGKHHALDCYDPNGKLLWSINAPIGPQQSDDFLADNVIGEFHEPGGETVLASWLWHASFRPYLITSDGIYLVSLLDDTKLGPTSTWDESYKNFFQVPDGTAYIVNGANDAYHIDKIIGLDKMHRFTGTLNVSMSDFKSAASGNIQTVQVTTPKPSVRVGWVLSPPPIDGNLAGWAMSGATSLTGSKGRSARVLLTRDLTHLYLAYEVHGAKWVNKGGNWQTLFTTGDCVDLMLHTGPWTPHYSPAIGDERVLISIYQGQPIAVRYRPVVTGTTRSTRLMATDIDEIVRLESAKIVAKRTSNGYVLTASIPLTDVGLVSAETEPVLGDLGVIFADETGSDRALRLYRFNQDTSMTADLSTEARLQPGNWGVINLPLGQNMLNNGGFDSPLSGSSETGWSVSAARSSATARVRELNGNKILEFTQSAPVIFTPSSYALQDYGAFITSANGGKGGGFAEVRQTVHVVGGHKYSLQFRLRTVDFPGGEKKEAGPGRGYVSLSASIFWNPNAGNVWLLNHQDTTPDWSTLTNPRFNYYGVRIPYTAPANATSASILFSLTANAAGHLPKAYVDDVEFVEVK